jgi:hypothetical protein
LSDPSPPTSDFDITPVTIEEEMKRSYLDYAMSVIVARALPDVRDGLKPVHRRILYARRRRQRRRWAGGASHPGGGVLVAGSGVLPAGRPGGGRGA